MFNEVRKAHRTAALQFVARSAFGPSGLRMLNRGAGNTLRAYLTGHAQPKRIRRLRARARFDAFLDRLVLHVPTVVRTRRGRKPSYGQKAKIVNLYMKTLGLSNEFFEGTAARRLRPLLHVPLDSIILRRVTQDFGEQLFAASIGRRDLRLSKLDRQTYRRIQMVLRAEAAKKGVPAIWYDDHWAIRNESELRRRGRRGPGRPLGSKTRRQRGQRRASQARKM